MTELEVRAALEMQALAHRPASRPAGRARPADADDVPPPLRELLERAQKGDMLACHRLGVHFGRGDSVRRNPPAAAYWYRQAMEQGHALSAFNLAQMYRHGEIEGTPAAPSRR